MIGKNNLFNIRFSRNNMWIGQVSQTNGFVNFSDVEYGIRAAALLIMRSYRSKDVLTISEIVNRYAPASENNTSKYIDFLCARLGCFPFDIPKDYDEYVRLLYWICVYEVGEDSAVSIQAIDTVCKKYNIKPIKLERNEEKDC